MDLLTISLFILTLVIMLLGLLGAVLPVIPGLPIIWVAALLYGWVTGFTSVDKGYLITYGILSAGVMVFDYIAGVYGAKKLGASRWGMVGAFAGMIIGVIVGTLPGFIIGPLIGAVVFELLIGRTFGVALKAGIGTFIGFLTGTVAKLILSSVMIAHFIWLVFFSG